MDITKRKSVKVIAVSLVFILMITWTIPPQTVAGSNKEKVIVSISHPSKKVQHYQLDKNQVVAPLEETVPTFLVDGAATSNARKILNAKQFSIKLSDGSMASWKRSEKREFTGKIRGEALTISWQEGFSTLYLKNKGDVNTFKLSGLEGEELIRAATATIVLLGSAAEPALSRTHGGLAAMTGGEVIVVIVAITAVAWLTCAISGTAMCAAYAAIACGEGNVLTADAKCGVSAGDESYIPDFGFGCEIECKPSEDPPGKPFPPELPGPPQIIQLPGPGPDCDEETQRPDFCIVGWRDTTVDDGEGGFIVTTEAIVEPCCVPK